jgi:acyl dehydratase
MIHKAEVICPVISRVDIAWICIGTNDGHPLHLDHEFAKDIGYKDVVVPAHFLIGWVGQYLEEWCGGPENILSWTLRFSAPVWPGDRITLRGEPSATSDTSREAKTVTVQATTENGRVVGIATAKLRME